MEDKADAKIVENDGDAKAEEAKKAEAAAEAAKSKTATGGDGVEEAPRRNAEFWQKQTEREKTRNARAEFFKTKHKVVDPDTGAEHEEETPLTRAEVSAMLERRTQEEEARSLEQADNVSVTSFLAKSENAKFIKYEAKARTYLKAHPYYPLAGVFRDLAYDDALVEGAARGAKAKDKNERAKIGGDERRPVTTGGMPDFSGMKPAERTQAFRAFKSKVRKGQATLTADEE